MPEFCGVDPGSSGGVALVTGVLDLTLDEFRPIEIRLHPMPVLERDGGGREVDVLRLRLLLQGVEHDIAHRHFDRIVIERPQPGGQGRGAASSITQGANFGEALAVLKFTGCPIDQQLSSVSTRRELGLPTVPRGGDRKAANVTDAEALLASLRARHGAFPIHGPPPARGYSGLLGGPQAARSGMADAFLLAWLGVRRWLGVARRKSR